VPVATRVKTIDASQCKDRCQNTAISQVPQQTAAAEREPNTANQCQDGVAGRARLRPLHYAGQKLLEPLVGVAGFRPLIEVHVPRLHEIIYKKINNIIVYTDYQDLIFNAPLPWATQRNSLCHAVKYLQVSGYEPIWCSSRQDCRGRDVGAVMCRAKGVPRGGRHAVLGTAKLCGHVCFCQEMSHGRAAPRRHAC